ncbi:MAG TPA: trypsin-like peptidase domain-containing protein [Nocardioidaceae bacterium]|nr:trypsin-like peptidase domain-containing protein [Nocardioidaceae bacterium]
MALVLMASIVGGGYELHQQSEQLHGLRAQLRSQASTAAEQQKAASKQAIALRSRLKALQGQLARLDGTVTATQNRLIGDEKQLRVTQQQLPPDLVHLAPKVTPSVVTITCGSSLGTGFALRLPPAQGFTSVVVTAAHVVRDCATPQGKTATAPITMVTHEGQTLTATLQAMDADPRHDVATLGTTASLPTLQPADQAPQPGEFVMVVGSPLGLSESITSGNVSKVGTELITYDAAISNGNSGGPPIDEQ